MIDKSNNYFSHRPNMYPLQFSGQCDAQACYILMNGECQVYNQNVFLHFFMNEALKNIHSPSLKVQNKIK